MAQLPPGIAGYELGRQADQRAQQGQIQLIGILSQLNAQQEAQAQAREMAPFKQRLLNAQIADVEQKPDDRVMARENTKQIALSRLTQQAQIAETAHQRAMATITDLRERRAEIARHNQVREAINQESLGIAGRRLFHDTGMMPPGGFAQAAQPTAAPGILASLQGRPPAEQEAIQSVMSGAPSADVGPYDPATKVMQPGGYGMPQGGALASLQPSPATAAPTRAALYGSEGRFPPVNGTAAPAAIPAAAVTSAPEGPATPKQLTIADAPEGLTPKMKQQWLLQQSKPSIAGAGTFTPQALEFTAKQYLSGDRQAVQGFARSATARIGLQNAIVDEAAKQGMSPEATAAKIAEFAGVVAGSRTVGQRAANISLAATEAHEMLGIVKETSDKFGRTRFVPWNMALRAYESGTGEPEIAAFGASVNALVNVYARAINPTGVPTVSDKDHARAVLNTVQSPAQVDAVLGIIRRELEIAMKAPATVRESTRKGITGEAGGLESQVKALGVLYEPDKYEYRIDNGKVQRKAK